MAESSALPFRMLRRGLRAATRAGSSVVERVLRREDLPEPFVASAPSRGALGVDGDVAVIEFGTAAAGLVASPVPRGATVLEAANAAGVDLRSYCGGNCSCGTCRIEVVAGARNLSRSESLEQMVLGPDAAARGDRLACQAQVLGDARIHVPDWF